MPAKQIDRMSTIKDLVSFATPLSELRSKLSKLSWDYEGEQVILGASHIVNVLQKYLNNDLCATEVEDWANAIEGREDIEFDSRNHAMIEDIVHELANPVLTQPLTPIRAHMLCRSLTGIQQA